MTDEKRSEIMKSHIFGCDNAKIAEIEEVSIEEVEEVLSDTEAIKSMTSYLKQEGYIE